MARGGWRGRASYAFDNLMARGALALAGLLLLVWLAFLALVTTAGILLGVAPHGGAPPGLSDAIWFNLLRTLDPGMLAGDEGWGFRFANIIAVVGGLLLLSTFIGVVVTGIERRLHRLRQGRSLVIEQDHTLILGWSPQVFSIVAELAIANENRARAAVVLLADRDKVDMEEAIRTQVAKPGRTRIVCRSGNPIDMADLEIANPQGSRAIIVPSPESADPDAHVIKTLLALVNSPNRRPEPYHIVAALRDPSNADVARMVGGDEVRIVLAGDLIARIAVQTCRQSGLSTVYTELLDFRGDEIYFAREPRLDGLTFGEALLRYDDSAVIGVRSAGGAVAVLPAMDTRLSADDEIIAIAADDDRVRVTSGPPPPVDESAIRQAAPRTADPERTLMLGWNRRAPLMIDQLDAYVAPGSLVTIVSDDPAACAARGRAGGLRNLTVSIQPGDTVERAVLEPLMSGPHDHIIVLGDSDRLGPQEADARTLITLLHLRDLVERRGLALTIVGEMLDVRNRELAEATRADDFVVSDRLVSLMLSQISENRDLAAVFAVLFDAAGAELYLRPAVDYVLPGRPVSFYTVVESARRRGEAAIGYRLKAEAGDAARAYGVHVNPRKRDPVTFADGDRIIVLADA